jgi:hypothetical protein
MKAKMYSGLNSIKKVTKNYTLKGTPADLTGILQQVVELCALHVQILCGSVLKFRVSLASWF